MCCTRLAWNIGCKSDAKNRHLGTIAQLCLAVSSQLGKMCINSQKKLVKQQYLLHMSPQYGELWPTNGWDRFGSFGHPTKFQRVSRLAFVTAATLLTGGQPNFARCLPISWVCTLCIHFWGLLPPYGILPSAKFIIHPSLAFSYIGSGSVTARHSSSGHQPNFVAWYKEWNYGTFTEGTTYIRLGGYHVGNCPHSSSLLVALICCMEKCTILILQPVVVVVVVVVGHLLKPEMFLFQNNSILAA